MTIKIVCQFASACVALITISIATDSVAQNLPAATAVSDNDVSQWIQQLNAASFEIREMATRRLVETGFRSIDGLVNELLTGRPESSWRASRILNEIALNGSEADMTRIARIYFLLAENGHPYLRDFSLEMIDHWKQARRQRTIEQLKSMGAAIESLGQQQIFFADRQVAGQLADDPSTNSMPIQQPPAAADEVIDARQIKQSISEILSASAAENRQAFSKEINHAENPPPNSSRPANEVFGNPGRVRVVDGRAIMIVGGGVSSGTDACNVTLDKEFQLTRQSVELLAILPGINHLNIMDRQLSEDDLAMIGRLNSLPSLSITNCTYDAKLMIKMMRSLPQVYVSASTNGAFLGVTAENVRPSASIQGGCRITSVVENSAAEDAGLQQGDIIQQLAGIEVTTFQQLVVAIGAHQPGDQVQLVMIRGQEKMQLTLKLKPRPDGL